jgi:hypothetical protein
MQSAFCFCLLVWWLAFAIVGKKLQISFLHLHCPLSLGILETG